MLEFNETKLEHSVKHKNKINQSHRFDLKWRKISRPITSQKQLLAKKHTHNNILVRQIS